MIASPPQPVELAQDIVGVVARHIRLDLELLRARLAERLAAPGNPEVRQGAEGIAGDLIDVHWRHELLEQCERALAEAHEEFLVRAAACVEVARELEAEGRESWIAQAMRQQLAFDASRAVITAHDDDIEPASTTERR